MISNSNIRIVRKSGAPFLAAGWISAVVSLVTLPFIFGVIGMVMGILAAKYSGRAGLSLITSSILLMVVGMIFSDQIFSLLVRFLGF